MNLLGIETSCDETGVAIVAQGDTGRPRLLGQALYTQADLHGAYGGVVPELASRDHVRRALPVMSEALVAAGVELDDVDGVAYTRGPGLAGALLVGAGVAASLALALDRPAIGIHHLEGHLLSPFLSADPPAFPFVALLVSGGHTQLLDVTDVGQYRLLGDTMDDAAGEAFDKSAKLLGLPYPGGPALARLAEFGDAGAYALPRPLLQRSGSLDFSFAGLKTAVRTYAARLDTRSSCEQPRADLAAATQEAIVDVLVAKSIAALDAAGRDRLVVAGGVGANTRLRERLDAAAAGEGEANRERGRRFRVHYPEPALCTDNGAMIALAAAMRAQRGLVDMSARSSAFDVKPRWPLADLVSA